jgi:hypothetical protein
LLYQGICHLQEFLLFLSRFCSGRIAKGADRIYAEFLVGLILL